MPVPSPEDLPVLPDAHEKWVTREETLDTLLARARARAAGLAALSAAGQGLLAAATVALVAAAFLGTHPVPLVRELALLLGGLALLAGPLAGVFVHLRASNEGLARTLTEKEPRLRSLLLSSLELRSVPEGGGLSTSLIRAQAAYTASHLAQLDPLLKISDRDARAALALGLAAVLCAVGAFARGPEELRRGLGALRHLAPTASVAPERDPITGDIELTFFYPAHTRLAPRTVAGTNGEIEAPAGTEIRLRTRADRPVKEAAVVVNGTAIPLTIEGARQLSGSFTVSKAGSYLFRFGPAAHPVAEGPPIPIAVQADLPPRVTLSSPPETLEVEPRQVLKLVYQASDDYGLSKLRIVYRLPGSEAEQTVELKTFDDPPLRDEGTAKLELAALHLGSGDEVSLVLEALDNDSVQGPKAGRSRPRLLKVFSEVEHHREAIGKARALWERMLLLLADRLDEGAAQEPVKGGEGIDAHELILAQDMEHEALALLKDKRQTKPLPTALLNAARGLRSRASATSDLRGLAFLSGRGKRVASGDVSLFQRALNADIEGLERDTLYLEGLLDEAARDDLNTLAKELAERRRELAEIIEQYRKHPTPELKAEIEAMLARLHGRMQEMFARMNDLAKSISDQHLNREALAAMQKSVDMSQSLAKVDQQLKADDLDGALKSLDSMAQSLDTLRQRLENAKSGQAGSHPELTRKVAEFAKQLDDVQRQQKGIADRTAALQQAARKAATEKAPASQEMLNKLRADTEKAKSELEQVPEGAFQHVQTDDSLARAKDEVEQLSRALQSMDLEEARRSTERALDATDRLGNRLDREDTLRRMGRESPFPSFADEEPIPKNLLDQANDHLKQASPLLRSVRAQLEKLFPDERSLLSPKQVQELGQLQKEQQSAEQATGQLSKKLEDIGKEVPMDPAAEEALDRAQEKMQAAQEGLRERQPGQAGEQQRGALGQLQKLSDALRDSKGQQGASSGMPNPFALGTPSDESEGADGPEPDEHEKVVVPGADQYQVPAEFRRDILDAMKQKPPASFEDQVKHYYQEIVK